MAWPKITDQGFALREFFWAFINDVKLNKEWKIFFDHNDWRYIERLFLENYGKLYRSKEWRIVKVRLKGYVKEIMGTDILEVRYPHLDEWDNMNQRFTNDLIIRWAVKNNLIDDELLSIFKGIVMQNFDIMFSEKGCFVGLKPKNRALDLSFTLDELLEQEIKQGYVNKIIGDKGRKFAYTHLIRRNVQLTLQTWQKQVLHNWKQFNMIAGSRRIGKTFTSAYIAHRELYRIGGWYWARERQILYVSVSEEKAWQPFQYLKLLMKKDIEAGYIKVSGKEFTNTLTNAKLIFVTSGSRTGAKSYGGDLIIIDEAAEVSDDYWNDLLPIIMQEGATVFAISTINEWSQSGWFYRELLKGELSGDPDYNTIRVTIDDNELLTDKARETTKKAILEASVMKYWTELFCIFPNSSMVFKLAGVVLPPEKFTDWVYVIGYDPGKIKDSAWVIVVDMRNFKTLEEIEWKHMEYTDQWDELEKLKVKYPGAVVVMDRTGVGEAVFEIVRKHIDVCIKYKKSGGEISYNKEHFYYNVPKKELVETTQVFFDTHGLKINADLENLVMQLKGFKKIISGQYIQYEWVGVMDDLTNGLMLCCFYMGHIKGLTKKYQIQNETSELKFKDSFDWLDIFDDYTEGNSMKNFIY